MISGLSELRVPRTGASVHAPAARGDAAPSGPRALLAQIVRFLSAGGIAVICQWVLLIALVELHLLGPVAASCLGFAVATSVSYFLRRRFVFRSDLAHKDCLPRYVVVAGAALGLTWLVMTLGAHVLGLPYLAAQLLTSAVVASWNFTAHRHWTFRPPPAADLDDLMP